MFSGTPLTYAVNLSAYYLTNDYGITITGEDARVWSVESKTTAGFTVNSNSSVALTGNVYWTLISYL